MGDQRFSYNQFLTFEHQIGEETFRASVLDIVIESSGKKIATHIFAQGNPVPSIIPENFAFRIHENPTYQWNPTVRAQDFISILANITALKIRATYSPDGKSEFVFYLLFPLVYTSLSQSLYTGGTLERILTRSGSD